jgi:hypothetical protein
VLQQYESSGLFRNPSLFVKVHNQKAAPIQPLSLFNLKTWWRDRKKLTQQAQGKHSTKNRQPCSKRHTLLEYAMAEYIHRSNVKRGTDDVHWADKRLKSLAAYSRDKLQAMTGPQRILLQKSLGSKDTVGSHQSLTTTSQGSFTCGTRRSVCATNPLLNELRLLRVK